MTTRLEADSIGTMEVPAKAYYGVQSLRAKYNFNITGRPLHPAFINNLARIKKAGGYPVTPGFKIADIDPRREELSNCFLISDKSRCIAGSVLELVCAQVWQ